MRFAFAAYEVQEVRRDWSIGVRNFFTGNEMYEAVLISCQNLGTCADIYFVHQVDEENEAVTFGKGGAIDALSELKAEGRLRFTGVASHYYSVLQRGAADQRVDVLQGSGNILERGMLDRMEKEPIFQKKGILINKVFAAGILPSFFPIESLISGVLSYSISCALIGIGTVDQANLAMGRTYEKQLWTEFSDVRSVLEKNFDLIPCDRCQRCKCRYGTEIHILFRQYNYYFLGKNYWALRKLDLGIKESAEKCRQCTDTPCLKQCPKGIRIPEMVLKIHELTKWAH